MIGLQSDRRNGGGKLPPSDRSNGGKGGCGLPPLSLLQNGHLPTGIVPISREIPVKNNGDFGSEMDTGSDSEDDDIYGARYSPQDHKASRTNNGRKDITETFENRAYPKLNDYPSAPPLSNPSSVQDIEQFATKINLSTCKNTHISASENRTSDPSIRNASISSHTLPSRFPTYHASELGSWYGVISYEACVRLCLRSWSKGSIEAPTFLENECALLRNSFGLKHVLLQSEEEFLTRNSSELISESATVKPKKTFGKMKLQVRKVKMVLDPPTGCTFPVIPSPSLKMEAIKCKITSMKSTFSSEWETMRKLHMGPRIKSKGSYSRQSLAYMNIGTHYVSKVLKVGLTSLRHSTSISEEVIQETYTCSLRLKSVSEDNAVRMQPGSGETHVFLPDGRGDDLIIEIHDSKGNYHGRVVAQMTDIADDPENKVRWWSIYHEPEHELVGRVQLYINYSTNTDENSNHNKCGVVAETVAYDFVLETAMKVQKFQQRQLILNDPWKWLVSEFGKYYGVSDTYANLRYLTYIMDVATPTSDCLNLVHDLLLPVILKGRDKLSHQENRILGEVSDQIEQIIGLVFENYKSLDESSVSGMDEIFKSPTGSIAPALVPALKLYNLLHDILSSEAQLKLCKYFQTAARKRCRRHLQETEEFIINNNNNENTIMDTLAFSTSYQKMKTLCLNIRTEIFTDIEIHHLHVLPSFIDLPFICSSIYSTELCTRIRAFLISCPPISPSNPVTDLVISTADFQRDLSSWNINHIKGGVNAKELFNSYIIQWIQDKRSSLLELCKPDKVKLQWPHIQTHHPFIDDIYKKLNETLKEYDVIINRWPEYSFQLEFAIVDVEKAIVDSLEKIYSDILYPLKENSMPIKLGLKYVQKIAKGSVSCYNVSKELGVILNSMKRMLDILQPPIEGKLKAWGSCIIAEGENSVPGEHLSEITIMLRAKLRTYLQALTDKLVENSKLQNTTKLKKILLDAAKEGVLETDLRNKMNPLKELLEKTIDQLYGVFETQLFVIVCRSYWDRMGQDMLRFLEVNSSYKASRLAISVLDDTFASKMQELVGNALHERDLDPPSSILEARSMLCQDTVSSKDNSYFY